MTMEEAYSWRPRILDHPARWDCGFDVANRSTHYKRKSMAKKETVDNASKVFAYKDGQLVKTYRSLSEAGRDIGVNVDKMKRLCEKERLHNGIEYRREKPKAKLAIRIITVEGVDFGRYSSPKQADEVLGFKPGTCSRCAGAEKPYKGKYIITREEA